MRRIFKLYKAIKNGSDVFNTVSTGKRKWQNNKLLGYLVLLILAGLFLYFGYDLLGGLYSAFDRPELAFSLVLTAFLQMSTMMALMMSVLYAPSLLFMGEDNKILLPLPVRPWELLLAKMLVLYVNVLQIVVLFALPVFVCSGLLLSKGVSFYLFGLLTSLVVPCLPVALATLLSIVLISLFPIKINKDVLTLISTALMIALVIAFQFVGNVAHSDQLLSAFSGEASGVIARVIPNINLSLQLFAGKNVALPVALLLAVFFGCFAAPAGLLQKPFYRSLSGLQDALGFHRGKAIRPERVRGQFSAYLRKEFRMLLRTTANITYLFLLGIYMPVLLIVLRFVTPNIDGLFQRVDYSQPFVVTVIFWVFMGVMAWQCGYTQAGLTAISKEGNSLYVMKYLPVPMKTQLKAKLLCAMAVFALPFALMVGILIFMVHPPALLVVALSVCALSLIFCTTLIEMLFDLKNPKLTWLSEQQLFGGFRMILPLVVFIGGFVGLCFVLNFFALQGYAAILASTALFVAVSAAVYPLTIKENALKNLE